MAPDAQFLLGQVHLAQGRFGQAVTDFDLFLKRHPDNGKAPTHIS
jgi:TolA-binding protein